MAIFVGCGKENAHGRNRTKYKMTVASIKFFFFLKEKSVNRNVQSSAFILLPTMHSLKKVNVTIYRI